jgi:F0F1-type ATP synthase assembly protein I
VDAKFETAPWGVVVGLLLGFASFVLRLVRLARQLEQLREEAEAFETDREP